MYNSDIRHRNTINERYEHGRQLQLCHPHRAKRRPTRTEDLPELGRKYDIQGGMSYYATGHPGRRENNIWEEGNKILKRTLFPTMIGGWTQEHESTSRLSYGVVHRLVGNE